MNLPNRLTLIRVALIPVFLFLFYVEDIHNRFLWAFVVFVAASFTDMLDGKIARKRGLITDFGILMDPLADKLLVMAAVVSLAQVGAVHGVFVVVILAREFLVTSIRLVAAGKGKVIAADNWGKLKTVFQMIWIGLGLLLLWLEESVWIQRDPGHILPGSAWFVFYMFSWVVLALTVFSGVNYVVKNRALFQDV